MGTIQFVQFLVLCVCLCLVTQLYQTLCNPMDRSPPGSSVCGILQARILEWVTIFLFQEIFPIQGSNSGLPCLLHCRLILYWHGSIIEKYSKNLTQYPANEKDTLSSYYQISNSRVISYILSIILYGNEFHKNSFPCLSLIMHTKLSSYFTHPWLKDFTLLP